jgi:hypothetical protein
MCYNFYGPFERGMMKDISWFEDQEYEVEYEILAPGIYVYRNALPKNMKIIDRVEAALGKPGTRFSWQSAEVGYGDVLDEARKCKDWKIEPKNLGEVDEYSEDAFKLHDEIITKLKICLAHYCNQNYVEPMEWFEAINIVKYGKGEYFKVHSDDGEPYRCTISAVGYPNDDYEGGELWFPLFDVKHKPEAGDFVISPSAYTYAHSSEPVLDDGIKYSLVIMTDRNEFGHYKDSPIYYSEEFRRELGMLPS